MNEEQEQRIKNALVYGTSHPEMYKTELDLCKETIERQAVQIEMMREALGYRIDHPKVITALSTTPDQALEQFAAIRVITELPKGELK